MTTGRIAHLHLELDPDADPIAGVIRGDGGRDEPFSGWIELTRTIERTLDLARRDGYGRPEPDAEAREPFTDS